MQHPGTIRMVGIVPIIISRRKGVTVNKIQPAGIVRGLEIGREVVGVETTPPRGTGDVWAMAQNTRFGVTVATIIPGAGTTYPRAKRAEMQR